MPKWKGGLGFKKFEDINKALLSKLTWKVVKREEHLWAILLRFKYLNVYSFFRCQVKMKDYVEAKKIN